MSHRHVGGSVLFGVGALALVVLKGDQKDTIYFLWGGVPRFETNPHLLSEILGLGHFDKSVDTSVFVIAPRPSTRQACFCELTYHDGLPEC